MFIYLSACSALTAPPITGTTPPPVQCPNSLCEGKPDGNYEYHYYGEYKINYFIQCVNALAYCQPCFPTSLQFSAKCNQCLYTKTGKQLSHQN